MLQSALQTVRRMIKEKRPRSMKNAQKIINLLFNSFNTVFHFVFASLTEEKQAQFKKSGARK